MIARFTGGIMGLLAFGLATAVGLAVGNPAEVVLSRALWALAVFCVIGLAVGAAAQAVINEYASKRSKSLLEATMDADASGAGQADDSSIPVTAEPMGTE